jgi:hypothetical protein
MAQAFAGRPCTTADRFHVQSCPCDICSGQNAMGQASVRVLGYFAVSMAHSHSLTYPTGAVQY